MVPRLLIGITLVVALTAQAWGLFRLYAHDLVYGALGLLVGALIGAVAVFLQPEVRTSFRVMEVDADRVWSDDAQQERADLVIDCAGLHAHAVAQLFGDDSFVIRPRKGEFLVFDVPLDRILLPVPTSRTKGVLVFPTVHGGCVAGPTAIDQDDPEDWSVRPEATSEIMARAVRMHPALEGAEPVATYAGLRPAGVDANYLIRRSTAFDRRPLMTAARCPAARHSFSPAPSRTWNRFSSSPASV